MARFTLTVELTEDQLPSFIQVLGKITDLLSSIKAKDIARVEYHELNLDDCDEAKSKETSLTMPTAPSVTPTGDVPPKTAEAETTASFTRQSQKTTASKDDDDLMSQLDSHRLSPQLKDTQPTSVRLPNEINEFLVEVTTEHNIQHPNQRRLSKSDVINFALQRLKSDFEK